MVFSSSTFRQPVMFGSQSSHSLMCVTLWPSFPLRSGCSICVLFFLAVFGSFICVLLLLVVLFKFFFHVFIPAVGHDLSFLFAFVAIFRAIGYALVPLVACFVSCTALHLTFHVLFVAALLLSFTTVSALTLMTTCPRLVHQHCSVLNSMLALVPRAFFVEAPSWRRRTISVKTIAEMHCSVFILFEFF